ncbi:unnamed protein product, partial [marine sediment metagenome]
ESLIRLEEAAMGSSEAGVPGCDQGQGGSILYNAAE